MTRGRLLLALALGAAIVAFFALGLQRFFTLDALKAQQAAVDAAVRARPWMAAGAFFALYVVVTGLSLPGAAILTLAGGAVFGLLWGTVIVSFASSVGATVGMLASRFLFRDAVRSRFGNALAAVDRGMARDGPFYLFTLYLSMANFRDAAERRAFGCASLAGLVAATLLAWPAMAMFFPISAMPFWYAPAAVIAGLILSASCWSGAQTSVYRFGAQAMMVMAGVGFLGVAHALS